MEDISIRAQWARRITREKLSRELNAVAEHGNTSFLDAPAGGWTPHHLPVANFTSGTPRPSEQAFKVGIVGAGMAGLYTAMILDSLRDVFPGLSYTILEANPTRAGGRVYTHHFSSAKHDFYDIGAMRFPQIKSMNRTFDLIQKRLGLPMIPYYLDKGTVNNPSLYNDILQIATNPPPPSDGDPFKISTKNGGAVPYDFVNEGSSAIVGKVFKPYKDALQADFETGFQKLMAEDMYTTRSYFRERTRYNDFFTIEWLETMQSASGLYDQAFTESIIDSFDFSNPDDPNWYCLENGTSTITTAMVNAILTKPEFSKRVTAMTLVRPNDQVVEPMIALQVASERSARLFHTVFSSPTLASTQRMDLRGLELNPMQKDALRALHYDSSCKVGIKFSKPWWINPPFNITSGGAGSTDIPIRTCVYPSYNLHDGPDNPAVLICSYTWAQDAQRIGALIASDSPAPSEAELLELVLADLARLHAPASAFAQTLAMLKSLYVTHHAYDWSRDPRMGGAFALFGPAQFANLYPYLQRPAADARLHFIGEASSAHHAWIVGALDSAVRAVYHMLLRFNMRYQADVLLQRWGPVDEMEVGDKGTAHLQVLLGQMQPGEQVRV